VIKLITGQPGHGKTAYALVCALKSKAEGRTVYAHGIKDLDYDKIGFQRLEDPAKWQELPDGAVILLDECYTTFPNRPAGAKVPDHVEAMARHRHRGFDFLLIAQQGLQLDPFLRGLYEEHVHVRKKLGKMTKLLRWSQYQMNVKAHCADAQNWVRPNDVFQYYTSTVLDTSKLHFPMWAKLLVLSVAVLGLLLWYFAHRWNSKVSQASQTEDPVAMAAGLGPRGVSPRGTGPANSEPKWESKSAYAADHLARFNTAPWTAPVFDQRQVTADPELMCMSSNGGPDVDGKMREPSCTCLTEQGTFYEISEPECRRIARYGPVYNPYKQRQPQAASTPAPEPQERLTSATGGIPGAVMSAPQISGYGDLTVSSPRY